MSRRSSTDSRPIANATRSGVPNRLPSTYIFASISIYLRAVAHALEHEESQAFKNLFFVCPLFNGVKAQGREVVLEPVEGVQDMKVA